MMRIVSVLILILSILPLQQANAAKQLTITWDDLVPKKGKGAEILFKRDEKVIGLPELSQFDGNKEEQDLFIQYLDEMKSMQPEGGELNIDLHGRKIKMAGYVTPVGFDDENVTEFLFVPYLGACIHVPPPPANQIVYVQNAQGLKSEQLYEPIWLTGVIQARSVATALADVGYTIVGATIEPYTE